MSKIEHAMKRVVKAKFIKAGFNEEISDMAADIHMEYRVSIDGLMTLLRMSASTVPNVAYVCDGLECDDCYSECRHTIHVNHAANFDYLSDNRYIERIPKEE